LTQSHSLSFNTGTSTRSAGANLSVGTTGAFIPNAYSKTVLAGGNARVVGNNTIVRGVARFFADEAGTATSPLLSRLYAPQGRPDSNGTGPTPSGPAVRDSGPQSIREY